ncbi:MAG: DUF1934 domain-containing protein [Clostridia bacterium]|nr:DUF1934 domain-containing protein [Clostridia bacterium]
MTAQNIVLSVRGAHIEDEQEQATEFMTEGRLLRSGSECIIEYQETELLGAEDTTMRVTLSGKELRLTRTGAVESEFCFRERQIYEAAYETPFGLLQLSILPTQVESRLEPDEGHIGLAYVIRMGSDSAFNRLNIHYQLRS